MKYIRFALVLGILSVVALTGCSDPALQQMTSDRDQLQVQVSQLKQQVTDLSGQVDSLKNAPQEVFKQAVDARSAQKFGDAAKLLNEVASKYPASPEATQVPAELNRLAQAVTAKKEADKKDYQMAVDSASSASSPDKSRDTMQAYLEQHPESSYKDATTKLIAQYDEKIKTAIEEAKKPPVEITGVGMGENSIGTPTITLTTHNRSQKTIDGFEFTVDLFDNFDRPANHYLASKYGNTYSGISQHSIRPGGTGEWYWTLYGYDLASKQKSLRITAVHFTDGTAWKPQ